MNDSCKRKDCKEDSLHSKEFPYRLCDSHADELILRTAACMQRHKQASSASGLREETILVINCCKYGVSDSYHRGSKFFK